MVLASAVFYFPQSVHLAVIDPGVGSARRALILSVAGGSMLVGPDNGLLLPSAARLGGVEGAWEITNADLGLSDPSSTFHGRDVFAPAAAHLVRGVPPDRFGAELDPGSLVGLPASPVQDLGTCLSGEVTLIDRFGNLQTSFRPEDLERLGGSVGEDRFEVRLGGTTLEAALRESYSFGPPGEVQLVEDSHGNLALCVNRGSAADLAADAAPGTPVLLGRPGFCS